MKTGISGIIKSAVGGFLTYPLKVFENTQELKPVQNRFVNAKAMLAEFTNDKSFGEIS